MNSEWTIARSQERRVGKECMSLWARKTDMAKRRRYASEPFGPAVERLMNETGVTYRGLAAKTGLSAGYLNHLVHGNRPVPANDVVETISGALDVDPEYFREYRVRVITERLEAMPELVDRLYRRL